MTISHVYPGSPLTVRTKMVSEATLGVAVRSQADRNFYGVTTREILYGNQPIVVLEPEAIRAGRCAEIFLSTPVTPGDMVPVTNLVGFFKFEKAVSISDMHRWANTKINKTIDPEVVLDKAWFVLRRNGEPLKTHWTGTDIPFEYDSIKQNTRLIGGGIEIAVPSKEIHDGDAGAPVVTEAGELIGILVAASDRIAMVAPVHHLFARHRLDVFSLEMQPIRLVPNAAAAALRTEIDKTLVKERPNVRISGINIPMAKPVEIALTHIYGIGRSSARKVCAALDISPEMRTYNLLDDEVSKIRDYIEKNFEVEGDLRRIVATNIKNLMDLGCYRGLRHRKGLPVHGQRTHTNARTRKGKPKAIAGKKKVTK